jgi:hypothetical protein
MPGANRVGRQVMKPTDLPVTARGHLFLIAIACLPTSAGAWFLYSLVFRHAPVQDFMVFHTAARAVLDGNLTLLFDGRALTAQLNARFADLLDAPLTLHPWVYPPLFLLVITPFGLLPFAVACISFLTLGFAAFALALRLHVRTSTEWAICLFAVLVGPPAAFAIVVGQNAFLTTALMVGGFGLLSVAAFGLDPWLQWLRLMLGHDPGFADWLIAGRMYGQSMFIDAVLLGASPALAQLVQELASLAAALIVWRAFRCHTLPPDLQLGVLLAAAVIAAPHVSNYDALMLTVAGLLLLLRGLREGFLSGELILLIVTFGVEILDPPKIIPAGLLTPLVIAALIAAMFRRAGATQGGIAAS